MADNRRIWAFAIAGTAEAEFLVTSSILLPQPAFEVTEVAKTVLVDHADVVVGSLVFQGRLRIRLNYVGPPQVPGGAQPLLSSAIETPYAVRVSASPATADMTCQVELAHVQDGRTEILRRDGHGSISVISDQSILVVTARYGKHEETRLRVADGPTQLQPPQRPVISHFNTRRR